MIYEARSYYAIGGKIGGLIERMKTRIQPIFARHGMEALGYWIEDIGEGNKLFFILKFADFADREARWKAFMADPDFQALKSEPLVMDYIENRLLRLTSYSPEPNTNDPIVEVRIYDTLPGRFQKLHDRFTNHTLEIFQRHGIRSIGYWTEEVGTGSRLFYMTGYDDFGSRQQKWSAFMADPDWQKARADSEADGPIIKKLSCAFLTRLPIPTS